MSIVYRSLMADTPENTAASVNTRPATPRKMSLWRRVRRATRVVAAVVLGVVGVLALVAWPVSHVWSGMIDHNVYWNEDSQPIAETTTPLSRIQTPA
ncbi:MAG: hypothetical protein AB7Q00_06865 [Phycisphaerales bacterium]